MKKYLLLSLVVFGMSSVLASCGSADISDTNLSLYEGNGFSIQVPKAWVKVDEKSAPTPGSGKLE